MGVHYDHAFFRLAEYFCEPYSAYDLAAYYVAQHVACAYRRQLVGIAYHYKSRSRHDSLCQRIHEHYIYHRHLIYDNYIVLKRVFRISSEIHRILILRIVVFQKPVDRHGRFSRCFGYTLCSSSRRRGYSHCKAAAFEHVYYGIYDSRLTCTRSACYDAYAVLSAGAHSSTLVFRKPYAVFCL